LATLFDAEVLEASAALDAEFADLWTLKPFKPARDPNGSPVSDASRAIGTFPAIYFDPASKWIEPNSFDPREARRPGVETSTPRIEISPDALVAFVEALASAPAPVSVPLDPLLSEVTIGEPLDGGISGPAIVRGPLDPLLSEVTLGLPLTGEAAAEIAAMIINVGDQLTRSDGVVFRALSVYVSATGFVIVRLNRLS